jgi:4-hydroxybenzoate polyprenyltransferase
MSTPPTAFSSARTRSFVRALVEELRVHQWIKNLLVFVAPLLGQVLFEPGAFVRATIVFVAFCAAASGVYVVNDLLDLESDRDHPRERMRPFASGRLPLSFGALGPLLLLTGLGIAVSVSLLTGAVVAAYIVVSVGYSWYLKTEPLVDVFTLSLLYTLRVCAGQVALEVAPSMWLLSFSGFTFLSLALLKRVSEYHAIAKSGTSYDTRRAYSARDLEMLKSMGMSSTLASSVVLGLYINSESAALLYQSRILLWGIVPILLFWQARMWLAVTRGKMTDDPIVYAGSDWVSQLCLALILGVCALAVYT